MNIRPEELALLNAMALWMHNGQSNPINHLTAFDSWACRLSQTFIADTEAEKGQRLAP